MFKKIFRTTLLTLFLIYALLISGVVYLFHSAGQNKDRIAHYLCYLTDRQVTIESVTTDWRKLNPIMLVSGVYISGDNEQEPALSVDSLALEIDWWSLMKLWPKFKEFAVSEPKIEIVSLPEGGLQIAGIELKHGKRKGQLSHKIIDWFLNHQNISLVDGEVVWRRQSGQVRHYRDIAFIFSRSKQQRQIRASAHGPKGRLAFITDLNGDILDSSDWDASFQVVNGNGDQMLASEDLQILVEHGNGIFKLGQLDSERVTDILRIAGVGSRFEKWLFDAQLQGKLNNVEFRFFGPLFNLQRWELKSHVSNLELIQTEFSPSFQNLSGQLNISNLGGRFDFLMENSVIRWSKHLEQDHIIKKAQGQFEWDLSDKLVSRAQIRNAVIDNELISARNLNLSLLKYKLKPFYMDATAQLDIPSMQKLAGFFPTTMPEKIKGWWNKAFISGGIQNANLHYQGWLSKSAMENQQMQLEGEGYFDDLNLNYGPKYGWPVVRSSSGRFMLDGQNIFFYPQQAWIEQTEVREPQVNIKNIFSRKRLLSIEGKTTAELKDVLAFLFQGPLIKNEENKKNPPLVGIAGKVDAVMSISIPLNDKKNAKVSGTADIHNGVVEFPGGVQITDFSGKVGFTERTARSDNMIGSFLGGPIQAKMSTISPGKPPQLKISAKGNFDPQYLRPWVGKPLVSVLNGRGDWKGTVRTKKHVTFVDVETDLKGIEVALPQPEFKSVDDEKPFKLGMVISQKQSKKLDFTYGENFQGKFKGDMEGENKFFDSGVLNYGLGQALVNARQGIHININSPEFNADDWIGRIVDICKLGDADNTDFADALRTVHVRSAKTRLLGRNFADVDVNVASNNGKVWKGGVNGKNVKGKLHFLPRQKTATYNFDLTYLNFPKSEKTEKKIASKQKPTDFPAINANVKQFVFMGKDMGSLALEATPAGKVWQVNSLQLEKPGIKANINGEWKPHKKLGSQSRFDINVEYGQAGEALKDFGFSDFMADGGGSFVTSLNWKGGIGDFALENLNGSYELKVKNGRLLKIEPKSGRLLGLLNINAISRRLRLDFSDIFEQGLEFDRMESVGQLVDGDMILEGAYIISPSVFIQSEGRIGLAKEDYDMQVKVSPEFGGNIALFTALANPAAGALVFLTQKLFRKELSSVNYYTYEVHGPWKSPEIYKIDNNGKSRRNAERKTAAKNETN